MPDWDDLLSELDDHQPSPGIAEDALRRAHAHERHRNQSALPWRSLRVAALVVAGLIATACVVVLLVLAAGSHATKTPAPATPRPAHETLRQALVADAELLSARTSTLVYFEMQLARRPNTAKQDHSGPAPIQTGNPEVNPTRAWVVADQSQVYAHVIGDLHQLHLADPLRPAFTLMSQALAKLRHHGTDQAQALANHAKASVNSYVVTHPGEAPTTPPSWAATPLLSQLQYVNKQLLASLPVRRNKTWIRRVTLLVTRAQQLLFRSEVADLHFYQARTPPWAARKQPWGIVAYGYTTGGLADAQGQTTQLRQQIDQINAQLAKIAATQPGEPSTMTN